MIANDSVLIKEFDILFNKKIVFYGAGDYGKKALEMVKHIKGLEIFCFCETDVKQWQKRNSSDTLAGIPVIDMEELKKRTIEEEILIIISVHPSKNMEIFRNVEIYYPNLKNVYSWFAFFFSIELNLDDDKIDAQYKKNRIAIRNCRRKVEGISSTAREAYKLFDNNAIIVYQAGKVASTSICNSIEYYGKSAVHIHDIAQYNEEKYGYHSEINKLYRLWINNIPNCESIKVISLVRDPIARSISAYFQHFHEDYILNDTIKKDTFEGVLQFIEKEMNFGEYGYMFQWFEMEIKEIMNIDVLNGNFDKEKGYGFFKKDNIELLILTVEKLNENGSIIGEFCDIPNFQIINNNEAQCKPYSFLYHEVLKNIQIKSEILDYYYGDHLFMDFFYSEDNKRELKKRWQKNI